MLSFHRGFCLILAEKKSVQYNNNLDKDIWIAKAKPNPFKFKKRKAFALPLLVGNQQAG